MKKLFKSLFAVVLLSAVSYGSVYAYNSYTEGETQTEGVKITKKCPECKGARKVKEKVPCQACDQAGCPSCDYKGYKEIYVDCSYCNGTGKIRVN